MQGPSSPLLGHRPTYLGHCRRFFEVLPVYRTIQSVTVSVFGPPLQRSTQMSVPFMVIASGFLHPCVAFLPCQLERTETAATGLSAAAYNLRRPHSQAQTGLGITAAGRSARAGRNADTVRNWEVGRTAPEVRFVPRIIQFLARPPRPGDPQQSN